MFACLQTDKIRIEMRSTQIMHIELDIKIEIYICHLYLSVVGLMTHYILSISLSRHRRRHTCSLYI